MVGGVRGRLGHCLTRSSVTARESERRAVKIIDLAWANWAPFALFSYFLTWNAPHTSGRWDSFLFSFLSSFCCVTHFPLIYENESNSFLTKCGRNPTPKTLFYFIIIFNTSKLQPKLILINLIYKKRNLNLSVRGRAYYLS